MAASVCVYLSVPYNNVFAVSALILGFGPKSRDGVFPGGKILRQVRSSTWADTEMLKHVDRHRAKDSHTDGRRRTEALGNVQRPTENHRDMVRCTKTEKTGAESHGCRRRMATVEDTRESWREYNVIHTCAAHLHALTSPRDISAVTQEVCHMCGATATRRRGLIHT